MNAFLKLPVLRAEAGGSVRADDAVAVEEPLQIVIGGRNLSMTMRTPGNDRELAAGFLFTEGLIRSADRIRAIVESENRVAIELTDAAEALFEMPERRFSMTSACGVCGKTSIESLYANGCVAIPRDGFTVRAETLRGLPAKLKSAQSVFQQTGGIHAAGLFNADGGLEVIREDVGRHNAVDKLIGALFLRNPPGLPARESVLLVSGRASFELAQKAAMAGIPVMAAVGAPSSLAVETARRFGMTLAGFLRGDRFNIYSGAERVIL